MKIRLGKHKTLRPQRVTALVVKANYMIDGLSDARGLPWGLGTEYRYYGCTLYYNSNNKKKSSRKYRAGEGTHPVVLLQ